MTFEGIRPPGLRWWRVLARLLLALWGANAGSAESSPAGVLPARGFYSTRPGRTWEEYLVTGNGVMGAMVAGAPNSERIILNHALLHLPTHPARPPVDQAAHLAEIRQRLLAGQFAEASRFVDELAKAEGYMQRIAADPFIPALEFIVEAGSPGEAQRYARSVDFETGVVRVTWQEAGVAFIRELFISRPDNIVVLRCRAGSPRQINAVLRVAPVRTFEPAQLKRFGLGDNVGIRNTETGAAAAGLFLRAAYERPRPGGYQGYEAAVRVTNLGGKVEASGDRFVVSGADELLILARVEPSGNVGESKVPALFEALAQVPPKYETLLAKHRTVHGALMRRVSLDLHASAADRARSSEDLLKLGGRHPAVIERLFDASRYNIVCATGLNPPNLQGIWGGTLTPPWSSDFTTNGNLPVAVSHYLQANTPELILPLFDRLEAYLADFQLNARRLFNCRGINLPSHFSTHGLNNIFDATWPMTFWTAGAAWYAQFYYDYYLYTQDRDFLRRRGLPFLEQVALFYEDFLRAGPSGEFVFNPSYSPENPPGNGRSQACINATMDVMAANALLRSIIDASRVLNLNAEKIPRWQAMLARMPRYAVADTGELREWLWDGLKENHRHRHASHLLGLFDLHDPMIMGSAELREACRRVIDRRMEVRRQEKGGVMAFGMVHLAFAAAALGEADNASEMLGWLGTSYWNNNLVSTHNPGKLFNVDLCGGYPSLVMKMLAYAEPGTIALLPCVPREWVDGRVTGLALRGGIVMQELEWKAAGVEATLVSAVDQRVTISVRGRERSAVALKAGVEQKVSFQSEPLGEPL